MTTRGVMFQFFEWNCTNEGSLWRQLARSAQELAIRGTTAVWMPPAYKGQDGIKDTGYGVYDLYDLGEFDQKGTVRTKYGTRDEYLAAIKAVHDAGIDAYADVVLNHRMGGDETEEVEIVEVDTNDRNAPTTQPYKIHAWSLYNFPGRGGKYSKFTWHWKHFTAFGHNADAPHESNKIFRVASKAFADGVDGEYGNYDYLMGADVDHREPDVREELFAWGKWMIETTGVNGLRIDAVKHIPAEFYKDWFERLRGAFPGREIFGVGEYWSGDVDVLHNYIDATSATMRLFDVPLHYKFQEAAKGGRDFDLTKIFDNTLVNDFPMHAVTFVDNHDSQPGQSLDSWVADWFKPLAYALILLRKEGYPCVFYGDYFGNPGIEGGKYSLVSHQKLIDDMLGARAVFTYGEQHDYLDHPTCIGWVWTGEAEHPGGMAVVISTGDEGRKKMQTFKPNQEFRDHTGHIKEPITTDAEGFAEFVCPAGSLSIWCTP